LLVCHCITLIKTVPAICKGVVAISHDPAVDASRSVSSRRRDIERCDFEFVWKVTLGVGIVRVKQNVLVPRYERSRAPPPHTVSAVSPW